MSNNANQFTTFSITGTKLHVQFITLSTLDNTKVLVFKEQLNGISIDQKYQQKEEINILIS